MIRLWESHIWITTGATVVIWLLTFRQLWRSWLNYILYYAPKGAWYVLFIAESGCALLNRPKKLNEPRSGRNRFLKGSTVPWGPIFRKHTHEIQNTIRCAATLCICQNTWCAKMTRPGFSWHQECKKYFRIILPVTGYGYQDKVQLKIFLYFADHY